VAEDKRRLPAGCPSSQKLRRDRRAARLAQAAEGVGGDAEDVFEGAGEVELIAEAGAFGDLLDQGAGFFEPLGGAVHFQTHQKSIWRLVVVALEQAAQVGGVEVAFGGDLFEVFEAREIFFDVATAILVAQEREGFAVFAGDLRFGDAQGDAFEEFGAEFVGAGAGALGAVDEFVEEVAEFVRERELRDGSGRQAAGAQDGFCVRAGEIQEVF